MTTEEMREQIAKKLYKTFDVWGGAVIDWDMLPQSMKDSWLNFVEEQILAIPGLRVEAEDQTFSTE